MASVSDGHAPANEVCLDLTRALGFTFVRIVMADFHDFAADGIGKSCRVEFHLPRYVLSG